MLLIFQSLIDQSMIDSQLANNNNTNNNNNNNTIINNNNDGESRYLHKKFKKVASSEVVVPMDFAKENSPVISDTSSSLRSVINRIDSSTADSNKKSSKSDNVTTELDCESSDTIKNHYNCPYCKQSYTEQNALEKHIKSHTNEYPYCRTSCTVFSKTKSSRSHASKVDNNETGKVFEDSDVDSSDSVSSEADQMSGLSMPSSSDMLKIKTSQTGNIYKPKFHTALQSINTETVVSSNSSSNGLSSTSTSTNSNPYTSQFQQHIDKVITNNSVIVNALDLSSQKLMQHQQNFIDTQKTSNQPVNLSLINDITLEKNYNNNNNSFQNRSMVIQSLEKSPIILNGQRTNGLQQNNDTFINGYKRISNLDIDNFDYQQRHSLSSTLSPSLKSCFSFDMESKDSESHKSSSYNHTIQPLPSPGPLLGNTRLVDGPSCAKKPRIQYLSTLRSLDDSLCQRPNFSRMFGGKVKISNNSGETKTIRIKSRQQNSSLNEHNFNNKCATTETSSIVVKSGFHSGGTMLHKPPITTANDMKNSMSIIDTSEILSPIIPNISTPNIAPKMTCYNYTEPINHFTKITTTYNSFKLSKSGSPTIFHNNKIIPHVPGIPGPHTLTNTTTDYGSLFQRNKIPTCKVIPSISGNYMTSQTREISSPIKVKTPNNVVDNMEVSCNILNAEQSSSSTSIIEDSTIRLKKSNNDILNSKGIMIIQDKLRYGSNSETITELKTDKLDRFIDNRTKITTSNDLIIDKSPVNSITNKYDICKPTNSFDKQFDSLKINDKNKNLKFLRPTSLPLKPGTFTLKKHHGITPTVNTKNLITPDTPRPIKSYGQLYLNGHAYTYLGLKCSTKVFYCTLNRCQPMYVPDQKRLSMYSNWKICQDKPSNFELSHYDSRNRSKNYTIANKKYENILTHSSYQQYTPSSPDSGIEIDAQKNLHKNKSINDNDTNDDYIYVRGRGRGKYICNKCGIRCKKPSMLRKHIRSHTDVRPYTCEYCVMSFKTKGNLTKHTKSKSHYGKCMELGVIIKVPTINCDKNIDEDQTSAKLISVGVNNEESSDEEPSDNEESEDSANEEQEAAQSLLSLSQLNTNKLPGLISSDRPTTYPYAYANTTLVITSNVSAITSTNASTNSVTSTAIQSEISHRYYFSPNRSTFNDNPSSSSSINEPVSQIQVFDNKNIQQQQQQQQSHQPIDLTKKIIRPNIKLPFELNGLKNTIARKVVVVPTSSNGFTKPQAKFLQPSSTTASNYPSEKGKDGRWICKICSKDFREYSQFKNHMNIHYYEHPYKCEICSLAFKTKEKLSKHERSSQHINKLNITSTLGAGILNDPRPYKCEHCDVAFRGPGYLAKHLKSKGHIGKIECLHKIPFGTYAEMERSGISFNEIDTTNCAQSLISLQKIARKLYDQDPREMTEWQSSMDPPQGTNSDNTFSNKAEESCGTKEIQVNKHDDFNDENRQNTGQNFEDQSQQEKDNV
ncbi:metacaspase-3-like isoform X2 [Aphidius gifuensis]|uniref:metacaspase-3-like isoform X2 n=1 Tax=Aphidius gifuensis TaxID=684658 RepID=UPI001CDD0E7E|nr:metacaspase-3-like isoform X2 [Aphidius gifuensis]